MRYLGNKTKLLNFIEDVIIKYQIDGDVFADLFSGTGSVGDYFKSKYSIISNDYMYFSRIISEAKLTNISIPQFKNFVDYFGNDPFSILNSKIYTPKSEYFAYNNYTPIANRMFLTESNALKIDGIRLDIEEFYQKGMISRNEYTFLLASLLESITKVSNTSGTYQAFFKFWENRSLKEFILEPLEMNFSTSVSEKNKIYNKDSNKLAREIVGDIVYIDPPYTTTQYTNSYHLLETIARYDNPEIFGITGRRVKREFSLYSNKKEAIFSFEDLFRQLKFKHILISYSNQSIIELEELIELARKFALGGIVHVERNNYREYSTNNASYKGNGRKLEEVIIYFEKDLAINKSPLNYAGSKDELLPQIISELPYHVGTFVDMMGGAFNVGANIVAIDGVVYNEYNPYVFNLMEIIIKTPSSELISTVEKYIEKFNLEKKNKISYLQLRDYYNNVDNSSIILYILQIYAFQNILRFNSKHQYNTPVGNNEFNSGYIERIKQFKPKTNQLQLINKRYQELNIDEFPIDSVFYFDPPYLVTTAGYNDGKRGFEGWSSESEAELILFLTQLHLSGRKFMLSNVLEHKGKLNNLLIEWIETHNLKIIKVGKTGIKYPRVEVLIKNF
ncbi:modification methylase [Streptococcus agalactiae]|uniref:DNA adenine methylase n=1 Tax=Streptococcus agalactiae TaxID=1311 RepID=UPI00064012C8|nr:DNA adenine methylase [Streptococcus agalactiae]KLJ82621.1 modification methylase [Streptococcus agalactiae]